MNFAAYVAMLQTYPNTAPDTDDTDHNFLVLTVWRSHMMKNSGGIDRAARFILGVGLISIVFVGPQTPWGWLGLVPLVTAMVGWCPLYTVLGIRTSCSIDDKAG